MQEFIGAYSDIYGNGKVEASMNRVHIYICIYIYTSIHMYIGGFDA